MSAPVKEKGGVTFNWKIENTTCPLWLGKRLTSPKFVIDGLDHTEWTLTLERDVITFSETFHLNCSINRVDDGKNNVLVGYTISVIAPDGSAKRKATLKRCAFHAHEQHLVQHYQKEVLVDDKNVYLSKDAWTVRCRMWECSVAKTPFAQFFALTYIESSRATFTWSISFVSACPLNETMSVSMPSDSNEKYCLNMSLYMTSKNKAPKDFIDISIRLVEGWWSNIFMNCNISVLDRDGKCCEFEQTDFCLSADERIWNFRPFITRSKLLSKKGVYLPNDVLSLLFDIRAYGSTKLSEIVRSCFSSKKL